MAEQSYQGETFLEGPHSTLARIKYVLRAAIVITVQFPVLGWFFAPYNLTGVEPYLPEKSFLTCFLAIIVIFTSGGWLKFAKVPPSSPSAPLTRRSFTLLFNWILFLLCVVLARFTIPLISSKVPVFGQKLNLREYAVWGGIFILGATVVRTLPLFVKDVLPSADGVLANDVRNPVVYFRSFEKELSKTGCSGIIVPYLHKLQSREGVYLFSAGPGSTFYGGRVRVRGMLTTQRSRFDEQMIFAHALSAIGPYVALGRPTENFRDADLGAAKKYVSNEEWQNVVMNWLRDCAAIVIEAADSASLGWEIEQVIRVMHPTAILIIGPYTEREYREFVNAYEQHFPKGLPRFRPESRLLTFDRDWSPIRIGKRELERY